MMAAVENQNSLSEANANQEALAKIYAEIADFLVSTPTLEQLLAFRLSDESDNFIDALLTLNNNVGLTPPQQKLLDQFLVIEQLLESVKVRAAVKLRQVVP